MNFARDVVDAHKADGLALVELARDGSRRAWTFGEVSDCSAALAGTMARHGVGRGDVVMTLIGNRREWVMAMVACFRIGAIVLPCTEQLRAKDLRLRIAVTSPKLIVADERNRTELAQAGPDCAVLLVPDAQLFDAPPADAVELGPADGSLLTFTSGTAGEPKAVLHGQRYLAGQRLQSLHWLDAHRGDLVWCTAASGWSKSARNVLIAPWLAGATALLHDARRVADRPGLNTVGTSADPAACTTRTGFRTSRSRRPSTPNIRTHFLHACATAGRARWC